MIYAQDYNHYTLLDKSSQKQEQHNDDNDIYDTSELEHKFKYGIYEDVFKTEQLMAKLKRIDEAEKEGMFNLKIFHLNSSQMQVK